MKQRLLKIIVAALLVVANLLQCSTWVSASSETTATVADFGMSDPERNTTIAGSELLELILGVEIGDAEAAYVNQSGLYKFIYSETIPASVITAKLTVDGLIVTVSDWVYTAEDGESVR